MRDTFVEKDGAGSFRWESYIRARTVWSRENRPNNWYPIYVSKDLQDITTEKKRGYYEVFPVTKNGKEMSMEKHKRNLY